jgi:hypothetical protein
MNRRPAKRSPSSTQSAAQQALSLTSLRSVGNPGSQLDNPFANLLVLYPRKTSYATL